LNIAGKVIFRSNVLILET